MRVSFAILVVALAAGAAGAAEPWQGEGLAVELPQWQGRVRLGYSAPAADSFAAGIATQARLSGASLLGDYYFGPRLATRDGAVGGFRATSGLLVGSQAGLWGGYAGGAAVSGPVAIERPSFALVSPAWAATNGDASAAVPYLGLGYSGYSFKGGWEISADFGLMALQPGSALRLGRAFGGQSLDDLVRDLRLAPVLQLGVSYSF